MINYQRHIVNFVILLTWVVPCKTTAQQKEHKLYTDIFRQMADTLSKRHDRYISAHDSIRYGHMLITGTIEITVEPLENGTTEIMGIKTSNKALEEYAGDLSFLKQYDYHPFFHDSMGIKHFFFPIWVRHDYKERAFSQHEEAMILELFGLSENWGDSTLLGNIYFPPIIITTDIVE